MLGPTHADTVESWGFVGRVVLAQGDAQKAAEIHGSQHDAQCKVLGPTHPHTVRPQRGSITGRWEYPSP